MEGRDDSGVQGAARDTAATVLGPRSSTHDLVAMEFARAAVAMIDADRDPVVLDDVETVHRARVAARTLRSNLRTLGPLLDASAVDPLGADLRWLGEVLGAERDLDVLRSGIEEMLPTIGVGADDPLAVRLLAGIADDRSAGGREVARALVGDRYRTLLERLAWFAADPPVRTAEVGARRARDTVPRRARRAWRRVGQPLRGLADDDVTDAVLHEVRKRTKRARYAAELAAPVVRRSDPVFAEAMHRHQDTLGRLQDCVTAQAWLVEAGAGADDGAVAFLAGALWSRFDAERIRARRTFVHEWDRRALARSAAWMA